MGLQVLLEKKKISKYQLAKISGVPKTTIIDICAGRSQIERCSAKTVMLLAKALDCSMEEIIELSALFDEQSGLPKDPAYLECGLPPFLTEAIEAMKSAWDKLDRGENYLRWDCDYCSLQTAINNAEVNLVITPEQAHHLRIKYLRMEND